MLTRKTALFLSLVAALALLTVGCGGDDSTTPTPQTLTLSGVEAEDFSTSALDMMNELVNSVPDFAAADFGSMSMAKSPEDSLEWDPALQAYTYTFDGPLFEVDPPNTWEMRLAIWLQYRNAVGTPLQYPIGATEMELDYTTGMTMHMVEDQTVMDMDYDMDTNMIVTYLGEGESYGIVGNGTTTVSMSTTSPQGSQAGQFAMDWAMDMVSSPNGCPSGTATVNVQDFTLNAVYNGEGGVSWTLTGPDYQASGTDYLDCYAPVK